VVKEVRDAWMQAASLVQREQLLAEQLALYARFDTMVELRYRTGSISLLAKSLAEQRYDNLSWQLKQLAMEKEGALRQLATLLQLDAVPATASWPGRQTDLALTTSQAHPGLRMLQEQERLMMQQQRLSAAGFSPSVGVGYFNQSLEQVPGFQGVSVSVGVPLAFFGRQAAYKSSRVEREGARVAVEAGALRINYALTQAQRELRLQQERLDYFDQIALPRAESILQNANRLFEQGETEYFEYLQSLDAVLAIRLDRLQHELNFQLAANTLAEISNVYGF
jgi:cobalt-zinc-cadmium resistance protein CzcA